MRIQRIVFLLLIVLLAIPVQSADVLIPVVTERKGFLRKGGPIPVDLQITNRGTSILEGRIELSTLRFGRKAGTIVSPEMALPPGVTNTQMWLSPPDNPHYGEGVAVKLEFVGANGTHALGEHRLGKYPEGGDGFVIAAAHGSRPSNAVDLMREQSAKLENLRPALEARAWFESRLVSVPADQLPTQVAGWCAYDLVLIDDSAFSAMSARQLDTFARWIEAGGCAWIMADGPFGERQRDFARRLATQEQDALHFDETNRLIPRRPQRYSPGLGRLLLDATPPLKGSEFKSADRRRSLAWLWKVRPEWTEHIVEHGVWPTDRAEARQEASWDMEQWARSRADEIARKQVQRPQALPIGWMVALLAGLLLLAGPIDYAVLGWLRRRRWTWLIFPLLCGVFAWVAWRMAVQVLGPKAREFTLRITDLGAKDRVLRDVTMQRRIPGFDEEWTTDCAEGVASALPSAQIADGMGGYDPSAPIPETRAEWLTPSKNVLRQNLRQWTVNWRQTVSFAAKELPGGPRWEDLILRWKNGQPTTNLTARHNDYHVYYSADAVRYPLVNSQVLHADSPLTQGEVEQFAYPARPQADVLSAAAPRVAGPGALSAAGRSELIIFAWRQEGDTLHLFRRHISQWEMDHTP